MNQPKQPSRQMQRLARWLNVIPYFRTHPDADLDRAAADLGVTVAQLRKDLTGLTMCGLPGMYPGDLIEIDYDESGVDIGFSARIDRPLKLTGAEAASLLLALRGLADSPGVADPAAVLRAIAKLEAAVAGAGRDTVASINGARTENDRDTEIAAAVHSALRDGRALHLRYYSATRDTTTERDVDPIAVDTFDGHTYLQAWCRRSEGLRMFRLDRIDEARVLDEPSRVPEHVEPASGLFDGAAADDLTIATVDVAPGAAWALEYHPFSVVGDGPDGAVTATMPYATESWMVRFVLSFGGELTVREPASLAAAVAERAAAGLANYS
ncbi:helix-turn-helix transcriptional regulator [Tsukamurella strandjordii]|uniref:WYL domain-containing protein n=1 Tax=Tsukamurella strandjordii TaxID=147577 RepID=A0AA90SKL0_9ACTN|nr:WYL domain-containing protein [Tsukamurella strandjordii]MDP0397358.1 WYL domain-containing protein [Tsukamurella strandjordii]